MMMMIKPALDPKTADSNACGHFQRTWHEVAGKLAYFKKPDTNWQGSRLISKTRHELARKLAYLKNMAQFWVRRTNSRSAGAPRDRLCRPPTLDPPLSGDLNYTIPISWAGCGSFFLRFGNSAKNAAHRRD